MLILHQANLLHNLAFHSIEGLNTEIAVQVQEYIAENEEFTAHIIGEIANYYKAQGRFSAQLQSEIFLYVKETDNFSITLANDLNYYLETSIVLPTNIKNELTRLASKNDIVSIKANSLLGTFGYNIEINYLPDNHSRIDDGCISVNTDSYWKSMSGNKNNENKPFEEKLNNTEKLQVKIYPNPANNTLFIELDKIPHTSVQYTISSVLGELIQTGYFNGQKQSIDISALSNGIYFINIMIENQSKTVRKFVKQ